MHEADQSSRTFIAQHNAYPDSKGKRFTVSTETQLARSLYLAGIANSTELARDAWKYGHAWDLSWHV